MSNFLLRTVTAFFLVVLLGILSIVPSIVSSLIIAALLMIVLVTEWPKIARNHRLLWWLVPVYPILPFIMLIVLNESSAYRPLLGLAIILSAVHDTGSYVAGNLFGRHLIAPHVSPGKTWEGFCGGLVLTMIVFMGIIWYIKAPIDGLYIAGLSTATSIVAFFGDLLESWLKRIAKIKDSGRILPGHGGILDRVDSILLVASFFYVIRHYLFSLIIQYIGS
jgi:phosphatidate cytidylyltransferase